MHSPLIQLNLECQHSWAKPGGDQLGEGPVESAGGAHKNKAYISSPLQTPSACTFTLCALLS